MHAFFYQQLNVRKFKKKNN